jgi:hypothetical protein
MKIDSISLTALRNDEHFQFNTEFRDLVNRFGAPSLNITAQFDAYLPLFAQEDEALQKIIKSAITADLQEADRRRDLLFRGMADANRAALRHFDPTVSEAARRLKIVFDTYGNLAAKPLNEETSAIYNILQEFTGRYAADASLVGLHIWTQQLDIANHAFDQLMKERYDETATRTHLVMKQCRVKVDEAYRVIIERLNALVVLQGEMPPFGDFILTFNAIIAKYATALAHHHKKQLRIEN